LTAIIRHLTSDIRHLALRCLAVRGRQLLGVAQFDAELAMGVEREPILPEPGTVGLIAMLARMIARAVEARGVGVGVGHAVSSIVIPAEREAREPESSIHEP
jgi:hypothetical protein